MFKVYVDGSETEPTPIQQHISKAIIEKLKNSKKILINDPPGTGKTLGVLHALSTLDAKALILVPNVVVIDSWTKYSLKIGDNIFSPEKILSKRLFYCMAEEDLDVKVNATSIHLPCNYGKNIIERTECRYYKPPLHGSINISLDGKVITDKYESVLGDTVAIFRDEYETCTYYDQFSLYARAKFIVMTYDKAIFELIAGRLPKVDILVMDEIDVGIQIAEKSIKLNEDFLKKLMKIVADLEEARELRDLITDISLLLKSGDVPLSKIKQLSDLCRKIGIDLNIAVVSDSKGVWTIKSGRSLLIITNFIHMLERTAKRGVIYISGTPMSQEEIDRLFKAEKVMINRKMRGRFVFIAKPLDIVHGRYFKYPDAYRREIDMICTYVEKAIFEMLNKEVKVIVPLFSYRHIEFCKNRKLAELYRENLHTDDKVLYEFKAGKRDILFSTKIFRGIHFNFRKMGLVLIKRPFPDIEDDIIRWKLSTEKGRLALEIMSRSYLYQVLGRTAISDENTTYIFTPDRLAYEIIRNNGFEINLTHENWIGDIVINQIKR